MGLFYEPSSTTLNVLNNRSWVASYSGGKDSTSVVTWIEWLRRSGQVRQGEPKLVMSDTEVEYPFLHDVAERLMGRLTDCGWTCEIVKPLIHEKLYNRIFGNGNVPVHPSNQKLRWCTRSTKIDPMTRYAKKVMGDDVTMITGVRWGESDTRDGKLKLSGCHAGGECGLPSPGEGKYGAIITWKTCQVLDWLLGGVSKEVRDSIPDLLAITSELVKVYSVKRIEGFSPLDVSSLRFGCIGCPAVETDKVMEEAVFRGDLQYKPLRAVYGIWEECYKQYNRCWRKKKNGKWQCGPVRMKVRQRLFERLLEIQKNAGVVLVNDADVAYIKDCWERKVYPRGWKEADEANYPPLPIFGLPMVNL